MMSVSATLALLVGTLFCVEAKDKKFHHGNMELKIDGKGGKFKIYRKDAGENETNKIEIRWDDIHEVDANGVEVNKERAKDASNQMVSKDGAHSIKDFSKLDFTFSEPSTVTLAELPGNFGFTRKTKATNVAFSSTVKYINYPEGRLPKQWYALGGFHVDTYIVQNDGVAGPDEESLWNVSAGDIKFNIKLSNWQFCGNAGPHMPCWSTCGLPGKSAGLTCHAGPDAETGEYVDVRVTIKGKNSAALRKPGKVEEPGEGHTGKGKKSDYELGGGITLFLTNLVSIDGIITEMPEGYPKTELTKDGSVFTFRFPRFDSEAVYDPIVGTGQAVAGQVTSGALGLGGISVFATAFMAELARVF